VAREALDSLGRRLATRAGLILIDTNGRVGIAHTTEAMAAAYRTAGTGRAFVVG
jgi:isoaspartyl peptidase/L-asparaginase-like protein (Ntn-hydrolase superfamily)